MDLSTAEENYVKAIYHIQQAKGHVSTNAVAHQLKTKPASVTDMLKRLKVKKILQYEPYQDFRLNNEGKRIALNVIRRHRLWEYFLVKKLGMRWDEVHAIAELLEHVSDARLIDRLDAFLEFPDTDPHGDPIPDVHGRMKVRPKVSVAALPLHTQAEVCGVGNQSTDMLELLDRLHIRIGTRLEVRRRFEFDGSLELKIRNNPLFVISHAVAQNLFVSHEI